MATSLSQENLELVLLPSQFTFKKNWMGLYNVCDIARDRALVMIQKREEDLKLTANSFRGGEGLIPPDVDELLPCDVLLLIVLPQ